MATSHKAAAEFYVTDHRGTVPALGDRAVLLLDARERVSRHHRVACRWAVQHGFTHYRLFSGTVHEPRYTSELTSVASEKARETVERAVQTLMCTDDYTVVERGDGYAVLIYVHNDPPHPRITVSVQEPAP